MGHRHGRVIAFAGTALPLALALLVGCSDARGPGKTVAVEIPAPSLAGSVVGEPDRQPARIYLPPSYVDGRRRYPVVYYLPGFDSSVDEYFDGSLSGWNLAADLERLHATRALSEFIVVVLNGRNRLGGSFYVDSPLTGGWESFVVDDVVSFTDREFRTLPDARSRALVGDSMGGSGALRIAMRHSDRFSSVYALSPGLFAPDGIVQAGLLSAHRAAATAWWRRRMEVDPEIERAGGLPGLVDTLLSSHDRFNHRLAFTWAYTAAFAPAAALTLLPGLAGDVASRVAPKSADQSLREALERGFGDLERKVQDHRENLLSLSGIAVDCGRDDRLAWIPAGCQHLADLLAAAAIPHDLRLHEGGHIDRLPLRLRDEAWPYLAKRLRQDGE